MVWDGSEGGGVDDLEEGHLLEVAHGLAAMFGGGVVLAMRG